MWFKKNIRVKMSWYLLLNILVIGYDNFSFWTKYVRSVAKWPFRPFDDFLVHSVTYILYVFIAFGTAHVKEILIVHIHSEKQKSIWMKVARLSKSSNLSLAVPNNSVKYLYYTATLIGISECQHVTKCSNLQEIHRKTYSMVIYLSKIKH